MHSTSSKHSKKISHSQQNGTSKCTSYLHKNGITSKNKCIYHYQATPRNHSISSATNNRKNKTNHTQASLSIMGPKRNILRNHHRRHFLTKRKRNLFNKCAETFVSGKSILQHPAVPNQRHRITIHKSHRGNNETNTTTVRLHRDAKRSHNNIQPKQHETFSPQRCELHKSN